jgi:hypothetical protein
MNALKEKIEKELLQSTDCDKQIGILQDINELILTKYKIVINGLELYPLEVEAYYYNNPNFKDDTVHRNDLQKSSPEECRFGKLYFHRKGELATTPFKSGKRKGVDICLSTGNYYFGVLIRSARINGIPICGPCCVVNHICEKKGVTEISNEWEKIEVLFLQSATDNKKEVCIGKRVGLNQNSLYFQYELRSLIEFKEHPFKGKENVAISCLKKEKEGKGGDISMERIKEVLGYRSKNVYEQVNHINNNEKESDKEK